MNEELAPFATRLAELLADERGARTIAQLQKLALLAQPSPPPVAFGAEPPAARLGVWEPERVDGRVDWVRDPARADEWRFWADVERISAKAGPRVVLLGESTARGYLFDPAVTFAGVLEAALGAGVEVVDLARTDLGLDGLARLIHRLPGAEPDAVVLFAGNNWPNVELGIEQLDGFAAALRGGGFAEARRLYMEELVVPRCRALLDAMAAHLGRAGVHVVICVPEFNLAGWQPDATLPAPVLAPGANAEWIVERAGALAALRDGRSGDAERHAAAMVRLDGGTSALSAHLAARTRLAGGDASGARTWFERARDAPCGTLVPVAPRCPTAVQDALRSAARAHGLGLVDLPLVFAGPDGLPERRYFLDYCHLSVEGMRVAAAALARELAPRLTGAAAVGEAGPELAVDPLAEATGHLLAAVHNAHHAQPAEAVRKHCALALERSGDVADHMLALLDAQCRQGELWLERSFARLAGSPLVARYLTPGDGREGRLADFGLMAAIVDALEAAGVPARARVERRLAAEHGGAPARWDLLDPRHRAATARERGGSALGPARAFFQASDTSSAFQLVCGAAPRRLRLRIACRVPGAGAGGARVTVVAGGETVALLEASSGWRSCEVAVPASALRPGVNRIVLEWEPDSPHPAGSLEAAARQLERGAYPDVLPVFGELHTLEAREA